MWTAAAAEKNHRDAIEFTNTQWTKREKWEQKAIYFNRIKSFGVFIKIYNIKLCIEISVHKTDEHTENAPLITQKICFIAKL